MARRLIVRGGLFVCGSGLHPQPAHQAKSFTARDKKEKKKKEEEKKEDIGGVA